MSVLLKTTTSVCPDCFEKVPADVVEADGRVYLRKDCPVHGGEEVFLASDARLYWNASKTADCGAGWHMTLAEFTERLDGLLARGMGDAAGSAAAGRAVRTASTRAARAVAGRAFAAAGRFAHGYLACRVVLQR